LSRYNCNIKVVKIAIGSDTLNKLAIIYRNRKESIVMQEICGKYIAKMIQMEQKP
jgi:hypothetical protein